MPHIYATNTDDLFFAQGYTIAQDRLWHMEMTRRVAQGRVAEIVGPAALAHDRLVRRLRFRGPFDDKEWTNYHPEARRIFDAYVRGINAFIAQNADQSAGRVQADRHHARAVEGGGDPLSRAGQRRGRQRAQRAAAGAVGREVRSRAKPTAARGRSPTAS